MKKKSKWKKTYSECQNFIANGVWPIMTQQWQMKTGQGRLLVRVSATILCVQRGMIVTKTSLHGLAHKISTNVDVARKLTARLVFTYGNTSKVVFIDLSGFDLLMPKIP